MEVRTPQQSEAELAARLESVVLTPEQVNLYIDNPKIVIIHGPPGTGEKQSQLVFFSLIRDEKCPIALPSFFFLITFEKLPNRLCN